MAPLPVTVIGGYLGAGKTTLVNHLLRHAAGRRLAVLVNEFGDLPIDADLIEAEEDGMISIAGGCICCSFGSDLIGALGDLAAMEPRPDHILVESSGVAIPGAIVSTMLLAEGIRSDGIVVVVDGETVRQRALDDYVGDTITRQLSDAEIVVVNKTDLLAPAAQTALMEWLAEAAPGAIAIPAERGRVAPGALLGVLPAPGTGQPADHSDRLFDSVVLTPEGDQPVEELARELATGSHGVIRAKGYLRDVDGALWLIQTVGRRWEVTAAQGPHEAGLVCIGFRDRLDRDGLAELAGVTA